MLLMLVSMIVYCP